MLVRALSFWRPPAVAAPGQVSFVGIAYAETGGFATNLNIDLSTIGLQADDFILLAAIHGVVVTWDTPSGFTNLTSAFGASHTLQLFHKQAVGSEGILNVATNPASSNRIELLAVGYRGVDWSAGPFGATIQTATGTGTTANPPAVTTVVANELAVSGYSVNTPSGTFPTDAGGPTNFTVRLNRDNDGTISGGVGDFEQASPGSVDPDQWAWGGSTDDWAAWTFGLRPA